jgi:predicted RNA-binding Zn-ribbon protein involved in translation (DUF1610 family)
MVEDRGTLHLPVNGEEIAVPSIAHLRCPKCGEIVLRFEDSKQLGEGAIASYRKKQARNLTPLAMGRGLILMSTNTAHAATDNLERLTWDEICKLFPDEWVVLVDIDWGNDRDFEFGTATVIARYKRRRDASPDIKAIRARNIEVGCFWTGEIRGPIPRFIIP